MYFIIMMSIVIYYIVFMISMFIIYFFNVKGHAAEERDVNSAESPTQTGLKARCAQCPRKSDRKTKAVCVDCKTHICTSHSVTLCTTWYPEV